MAKEEAIGVAAAGNGPSLFNLGRASLRTGPLLHAAARFELVGDHPSANQDLRRTPVA